MNTLDIFKKEPSIQHGFFGVPPHAPRHFASPEEAISYRQRNMTHALHTGDMATAQPILLNQTHSSHVHAVDKAFLTSYQDHLPPEGDGLVTQLPHVALGVRTADCGPLLWMDPVSGIIAASHAGWRGAVHGIVEATLNAMLKLGSQKENIHVVLGPTINKAHYVVGKDFRDQCLAQDPLTAEFFSHVPSLVFDLPEFLMKKLHVLGVRNCHNLGQDTFVNPSFYSRRSSLAVSGHYGSNYAFIMLKTKKI